MAEYDLPVLYVGIKARLPVRRIDGTTCPVLPDGTPCIRDSRDRVQYFYHKLLLMKHEPVLIAMRVGLQETGFDTPLSSLEAKLVDLAKSDFTDWAQQHKVKFSPDKIKIYAGLE